MKIDRPSFQRPTTRGVEGKSYNGESVLVGTAGGRWEIQVGRVGSSAGVGGNCV